MNQWLDDRARRRVLAVASSGGHWVQLMRLRPALEDCAVAYVTTMADYRADVGEARFYTVRHASRWNKCGLAVLALRLLWIILWERPHVIVSTGAAPGYLAIRIVKLLGAKGVWVDSIANVERLSMSGEMIGRHADLWLTQWPHLAKTEGPVFEGAVL